ncbi:MAG: hypothetical protein HZA15_14495 [Nitrospirae bacterium]|nr:hypothetical protein [Nitrospirota bacterium]
MKINGIIYIKVYANRFRLKVAEEGNREIDISASEPFTTERLIVGNFEPAVKILKEGIKKAYGKRLVKPIIVIHPLEKIEGGLSQIEKRVLKDLGEGAGARKVYFWVGPELSDSEILHKIENDNFI